MDQVREIAKKIFDDSKGFSKAGFSIAPYQDELSSLDPLAFVTWHANYSQLYFEKLMFATAFVWKDLSWEQWQEALLRQSHDFQSLYNLLTLLTRYLEIDAFRTLKDNLNIDREMINRLKVFFAGPLSRPSEKERAYMSGLNEMNIDFAEISSRLYQQGAPKAELSDPDVISL